MDCCLQGKTSSAAMAIGMGSVLAIKLLCPTALAGREWRAMLRSIPCLSGVLEYECEGRAAQNFSLILTNILLPSNRPGKQLALKNAPWGGVSSHSKVYPSILFDHWRTSQPSPFSLYPLHPQNAFPKLGF